MDAERLRAALAILNDALERPVVERSEFVRSACGGDAALLAEVRSLLDAHHHADLGAGFLEPSPLAAVDPRLGPSSRHPGDDSGGHAPPDAPTIIGGYTILRLLGAGGMGAVYLAEQPSPRRRVALKVLAGPWTRHAMQRFALEAEALGRLRHPGIAAIYETGFDGAGPRRIPFLAMELVEHARPIDEYATGAELDLRGRLALFGQVCDAVHHGHMKGVIHRDLKPANILVDAAGRTKVIDFGIARLGDDDGSPRLTHTGAVLGTPAFMAPEQCGGDARGVDVRSDVYALGAVAFELLCGHAPIDLDGLSLPAAVQAVRTRPVRRPRAFAPDMPRDVETILLTALSKEPADRYASVAALGGDIERYLHDRPIEARPTTVIHSMRLFARRHRAIVSAGLIAFLALGASTVVSTLFAIAASREATRRADAEREAVRDRDSAERRTYVATLAAAEAALQGGDFARMRDALRAAPEALRGWEWKYLDRRAESAVLVIEAHAPRAFTLAIGGGGNHVLSGGHDGFVRRWDATTGSPRSLGPLGVESSQARGECTALAVSPADSAGRSPPGELVAAGDADGRVLLLRLMDREGDASAGSSIADLRLLDGASRRVLRLRFSPDGSRLAAACADGSICVWDVPSGTLFARHARPGVGRAMEFFDEDRIVVGMSNGAIEVLSALDGATIARLREPSAAPLRAVQDLVRLDGDTVVAVSQERLLMAMDVVDGTERFPAIRHDKSLWSVAVTRDGSLIATGSGDRRVRVHDARTGELLGEFAGHEELVYALQFSPDGSSLWSASWDGALRRWEVDTLLHPPVLAGHDDEILGLAFSPSGERLASCGRDGTVRLWDRETRTEIDRWCPHDGTIWSVAWQPGGSLLATGGGDGVVAVIDVANGAVVDRLVGHAERVFSVAWRPDGAALVSGSADGSARIWVRGDDGLMQCRHELRAAAHHRGNVYAVAWSPSQPMVATASWDRQVRLWNADDGALIVQLEGHVDAIYGAAFSPDGALLATGGRDRRVILWDVAALCERRRLEGHGHFVTALTWLPDGSRLVGASWFDRVSIWSPDHGELLLGLRLPVDSIPRAVAVSPDGGTIASGGADGVVTLWQGDDETR